MGKLKELLGRCKCGVYLTVNQHRDYYETVSEYLEQPWRTQDIAPDILQSMIDTDTIIDLQFYPRTPVGYTQIFHYDLDAALDEALEDS